MKVLSRGKSGCGEGNDGHPSPNLESYRYKTQLRATRRAGHTGNLLLFSLAELVGSGPNDKNLHRLVRFGFAQTSQQDFWKIVAVTVAVTPITTSLKFETEPGMFRKL